MPKYPKGSYITRGYARHRILEEKGDLRLLSERMSPENPNWETAIFFRPLHITELERNGWVEEPVPEAENEQQKREEKIKEFDMWLRGQELNTGISFDSITEKVRELFLD